MAKIKLIIAATVACISLLHGGTVFAATLSVPNWGPYEVGQTFTVPVLISTASGESMNAVSGVLSFGSDKLRVVSLDKVGVLNFWLQDPSYSNSAGTISFEGGVYNPGFSGNRGTVLSVTFRALAAGDAPVSFNSPRILANDGLGTDITASAAGATFSIRDGAPIAQADPVPQTESEDEALPGAVKITSSTHPKQDAWYTEKATKFEWRTSSDITAIRLGYGFSSTTAPQVTYQPPISSRELALEDGVTYFAAQQRNANGWGPVTRYKVQIDTIAPTPVKLRFATTPQGAVNAYFESNDDISGIDHYELSINGHVVGDAPGTDGGRPYTLRVARTGTSTLAVVAYDRAGNSVSGEGTFYGVAPTAVKRNFLPKFDFDISYELIFAIGWRLVNYLSILIIGVGILTILWLSGWYIWHRMHSYRRVLLRRLARTDRVLHAELLELHKALKDEVETLKSEGMARALTTEEQKILKRFSKLVSKTERVMEEEFVHSPRRKR